jgi:hypothetical protein
MNDNLSPICNWCNQPSVIIWVHGHGQCSVCGINVDECCKGDQVDENLILPSTSIEKEHKI